MAEGDADKPYKPVIPPALHRAIRHLPGVVDHCRKIAERGAQIGGDNYTVIVQNQPGTARPRAYIVPINTAAAIEDDERNSTLFRIISGLRGM